ncbi:NAD-dependent epimerase/dehydratase family protein [uncultured Maricaulis sp.]|uniref:NAD-dependent epimerase/dehydratase family protein n=1 Tax=uncultured Maricaulis sp. TaxID=174710 RepID=UPI0030D72585|tara:strand:- start:6089 stop:7021 length:933 start_codon:yes stop_codon:yes gene_type:complete
MSKRVFITGAAGLVGQNLIPMLKAKSNLTIVAADKHPANTATLRRLHPEIEVIECDLSVPGPWQARLAECDAAIFLHAQIGGLDQREFTANNITATELCLSAMKDGETEYLVHISSSVVNSQAVDFYTESKKAQEAIVVKADIRQVILRPTLMFGWFDRKHLGWLRRFMDRNPVFPIPGSGRYRRQPLYAGDFSSIISACLDQKITGTYNISGRQTIDYIDMIRAIKRTVSARTRIVTLPYSLFWLMLKTYALFNSNPPFTTSQLKALATPDLFEVIDWPDIFGVEETPFVAALDLTFNHPEYAKISLEF